MAAEAGVAAHDVPLWAASMFDIEMTRVVHDLPTKLPEWEQAIRADERAKVEKDLRPAVEREMRARFEGHDPVPDTGTGGSSRTTDLPPTLAATRQWIDRMPLAEYTRREDEIDRHLASFNGRRPVATR